MIMVSDRVRECSKERTQIEKDHGLPVDPRPRAISYDYKIEGTSIKLQPLMSATIWYFGQPVHKFLARNNIGQLFSVWVHPTIENEASICFHNSIDNAMEGWHALADSILPHGNEVAWDETSPWAKAKQMGATEDSGINWTGLIFKSAKKCTEFVEWLKYNGYTNFRGYELGGTYVQLHH